MTAFIIQTRNPDKFRATDIPRRPSIDFHEYDTRKDDAANFRCRSAAKPHSAAEISAVVGLPENLSSG
jgi:hypothetical protein